jgi:hypothetical protein
MTLISINDFSALSPLVRKYRKHLVRSVVTNDTLVPLAPSGTNRNT